MAKVKVQITMEDKLLDELNDYCDKNYINRLQYWQGMVQYIRILILLIR